MTTTTDTHTPSRACYQHGCQSPACARANYQYMSRLRLEHHRGQRRRRSADQTRHHIERLIATKWTQAQIARAAGVAHRTIGAIRRGAPTVFNKTALAILSVPIAAPPTDTRDVDSTGTVRRIRALVAIGWPVAHLSTRFGIYPTALGNIARGELRHVRATTADTVAIEYQHLSRIPGPSQRARIEARNKNWHGPLSWDDNIDDPAAEPEVCPQPRQLSRDQQGALHRQEIAHLDRFGVPACEIAARLGIADSTVQNIVAELRTGTRRDRRKETV